MEELPQSRFFPQFMLRMKKKWASYYLDYQSMREKIATLVKVTTGGDLRHSTSKEEQEKSTSKGQSTTTTPREEPMSPQVTEKFNKAYLALETVVEIEIKKIDNFYNKQCSEIEGLWNNLKEELKTDLTRKGRVARVLRVSGLIFDLDLYKEMNYTAFMKLFGLHRFKGKRNLVEKVKSSDFCTSNLADEIGEEIDELVQQEANTENTHKVEVLEKKGVEKHVPLKPITIPYDQFLVKNFALGTITHLYCPIIENGFNENISLPVIVVRGQKPGPVVGITCALHGNEINGIPVVHRLLKEINVKELCGSIIAVVSANPLGYHLRQRFFNDGKDLNRLFPGKEVNGDVSQVYVHRLLQVIKQFGYLLDLHTASVGKVNSLYVRADLTDIVCKRMALLQNPQIILHNSGLEETLRGAAMGLGIKTITVEIGNPHLFQRKMINNAMNGVIRILSYLKMIPDEYESAEDHSDEGQCVICTRSYWIHTDVGGILVVYPDVNTWIKKGDRIATVRSIFGNKLKDYFAPEDGMVIGKNIDPVNQTGSRIIHLGIVGTKFT